MTNSSNKGPIGLPLRRGHHGRVALAMSAIEEERQSVLNASQAVPTATTPSSSSCDTVPITTSSSSDSSLDHSRPDHLLQRTPVTAKANESQSKSLRSVTGVEERGAMNPSQATIKQVLRTQSFFHEPIISIVNEPKCVRSNVLKSCSVRARAVPCFDDSWNTTTTTTTTGTTRKMPTTKALSVRSRPVSCFDDSLLDENTKEASKQQKAIKTTMSLRSRHASCFEDLLASDPTSLEGCKSRVVCTRPASNPAKLISQANSSALSPSSSEEQSTDAERSARRREKTPTVGKGKAKRSKSLAKRKIGHSRSPSDNDDTLAHGHALFDKGHDRKAIRSLSDNEISTCSSDMKVTSSLMKQSKSFSRLRQYEGKFKNRRGQSLLYFSMFPPEKLAMRGIVLHLHGMGDHCRRNTALYERHCKEGFGVITYDLLNHGESEYDKYKIRAHVTNFDDFVEDTNDFITFAKSNIYKVALRYWRKHHHPRHPHGREKKRQNAPELPLIISGASFGSLVGLHTVLSGEHKFHAAVWASPTIGVTWAPMLRIQWKFARPLVAALPTAKVIPAIQHNFRSRDPNFLKKYQDDPLTSSDMITPCSGYQSLHAMIRLQEEKKISDSDSPFCGIPMLFLAGSEDRISDQQAAIKFYTRMESLDKEFKLFDGLYHMIYEEPEKEDVLKYLVNWLHKRFPLETRHSTNSHVT